MDTAHRISENTGHGAVNTEEQRQAMVHYRALFDELLRDEQDQRTPEGKPAQANRSQASTGHDPQDPAERG